MIALEMPLPDKYWEEAMVTIDNIQVKKPDWCPLIDLTDDGK